MSEWLKKILQVLILLLLSSNAFSYVHMHGKKQRIVKWPSAIKTVNFSFNTNNTLGLNEDEVRSIIQDSVKQWNNKSSINVNAQETSLTNVKGLNEIYFSKDPSVFNGSGVVGMAVLMFKENTSEIIEADILINENAAFINEQEGSDKFLGNIITHEVGHALGLGHSLVSGASMFYVLNHGQYKVDADDESGIYSLYPALDLKKSEINGTIVGGKSLIPIFGTHVQAYSKNHGKIVAGSISETDGRFKIMGLDLNDSYYLYISAAENLGLSSRYLKARRDFCDNSQAYRGSFFQSCNNSYNGFPQEVVVGNSASIDIGNITVRCALDTPTDYLEAKATGNSFSFLNDYGAATPKSFTGYFTKNEVGNKTINEFEIDLSKDEFLNLVGDHFLEVRIRNQPFHSPFGVELSYSYGDTLGGFSSYFNTKDDFYNSLDQTIRLPLSSSNSEDNHFKIFVRPTTLVSVFGDEADGAKSLFYPGGIANHEEMYFYLADISIVKRLASGEYIPVSNSIQNSSDNSSCTDAKNTYRLTDSYLLGDRDEESRKVQNGTSCGSIDLDSNGSGGLGLGFLIGLFLIVLLVETKLACSKHCLSKHVGKLA